MTNRITQYKEEARRLRDSLAVAGTGISHSRSLELVARQKGFRDWNTLHGQLGQAAEVNQPAGPPVQLGQMVEGTYLGQPFTAEVLGIQILNGGNHYRVTLDLAEPVDVVTFESFSAFRRRISATINSQGRTAEKTSNGVPQMVIRLPN